MVLKRVFIVGSLSFIFALQGWGQASGMIQY
jgi:dipeptidyl-peptidase-4